MPKKVDKPVETLPETDVAETAEQVEPEKKTRHVPTRESVEQEFSELIASVEEEIGKLRETAVKAKGVKFLRTINKKLKLVKSHALRICKQRQAVKRNNTNSGLLKPVQISKDLAAFTGWNNSDLHSRVDVTKFICQYVKEKDLQNPEDRRQIRPDQNLRKLLKYDPKAGKPLTYYTLQTYLKTHYQNPATSD